MVRAIGSGTSITYLMARNWEKQIHLIFECAREREGHILQPFDSPRRSLPVVYIPRRRRLHRPYPYPLESPWLT